MSRFWNEFVAVLADVAWGGIPGLTIAVLLVATVVAVLWYLWPLRWLSGGRGGGSSGAAGSRRRWRWSSPRLRWRWRWPRWLRWRRRKTATIGPDLDGLAPDELPDLPAAFLALTADELAAAGRYAEAVRERLRAIVRELVEREVIEHRPGWTVTELAREAVRALPDTAPTLDGAANTFTGIWYAQRPATVDDDAAMRRYAADTHAAATRSRNGVMST